MWINFLNYYNFLPISAFLWDSLFGQIKIPYHPVKLMGRYIKFFEASFYKDSISRGFLLCISLITIAISIVLIAKLLLPHTGWFAFELILSGILLANKLLYLEVKKIIHSKNPKGQLKYLVSRDVENLSQSDVYKAAIETYAENLNDAIIAPLFYLLSFGVWGMVVYKCVNTLDSMVGYKTAHYEKFGKISARLDDVLNFIPARLTAFLVLLLNNKLKYLKTLSKIAIHHSSINAGYPIGAFAYSLGICLGGKTSYFGQIVYKPILGYGKTNLDKSDVEKALSQKIKVDIALFIILIILGFL